MKPVFDAPGDVMPPGSVYGTRDKLIHTVGVIGQVSWVSQGNHPYTGLFKGADKCFARMSLAGEPDTKKLNTAPGMGFKCVRDGVPSGNFVAMFGVDGQESWNFFKNSFVKNIPRPSAGLNATLGKNFANATPFIGAVGVSDFARYGTSGKYETNVQFPHQLRFQPTNEVPSFPDEYSGMDVNEMLQTVTKGTTLYDVYATDKPVELGGKESKIAKIVLDEKFVTSKWGDTGYFIRHLNMAEDLALRPEWTTF